MPCDLLMRWENEGGAVISEDEGADHCDRLQPKRSSRRGHDRGDPGVSVETGRYPGEPRRLRRVAAG
jgi:hypothetical protein